MAVCAHVKFLQMMQFAECKAGLEPRPESEGCHECMVGSAKPTAGNHSCDPCSGPTSFRQYKGATSCAICDPPLKVIFNCGMLR